MQSESVITSPPQKLEQEIPLVGHLSRLPEKLSSKFSGIWLKA